MTNHSPNTEELIKGIQTWVALFYQLIDLFFLFRDGRIMRTSIKKEYLIKHQPDEIKELTRIEDYFIPYLGSFEDSLISDELIVFVLDLSLNA
jgi:hypothetical protein